MTLHRTKDTLNLLLVDLPGFELKKLTSSPSDRRRLQTVEQPGLHLGVKCLASWVALQQIQFLYDSVFNAGAEGGSE